MGGYGYSYAVGPVIPYVMVHGEASYVSETLHKVKLAYGTDSGLIVDFSDNIKFQTALEWRIDPWDESRFINEIRFSNNRLGAGLYHQSYLIDGTQDLGIRIFFYF